MRVVRIAAIVLGVVLVLCVALLVSGYRVLMWEQRVEAGESVTVEGYGDLSSNKAASLVCRYFTGRSVLSRVYWYAPNNFMGRDSCPFLDRQE